MEDRHWEGDKYKNVLRSYIITYYYVAQKSLLCLISYE